MIISFHPLVLQSMIGRFVRVLQRGRLKDAHLILVRSGNLASVCAAVERRNTDIVVNGTRNNLDSFEIAGQYYNIATCRICLQGILRLLKGILIVWNW